MAIMPIIGSLQPIMGIMAMPPRLIPAKVELANYRVLLTHNPILLWLCNSLFILTASVGLSILITSMAGYALSVYRFPGRSIIFWAFVSSLMIPKAVMVIPLFVLMRLLGIAGTRMGAILPMLFWPFGILIFKTFCDTIPGEMIDR